MKVTMMIIFCPFPSNGAPVQWNWQGKTEELGEKPVPVPLCPPQIPHGRPAANRLSHGTASYVFTYTPATKPWRIIINPYVYVPYEININDSLRVLKIRIFYAGAG
jgi:hypothetical protein